MGVDDHHHLHHPPHQRKRKRKIASSTASSSPPPPDYSSSSSSSSSSSPSHFFRIFSPGAPGSRNLQLDHPGVLLSWLVPMMETEMQQMEMPSGAGVRRRSGIDQPDANSPRYTSLKDIIPASHSAGSLLPFDHHHHHLVGSAGFSSANITIKNQLVKHAASVYLQSTAMLANRNRSCFPSFWARAARRNPACTCLGVITGPICSFMKSVANQIGGFWACRSILV